MATTYVKIIAGGSGFPNFGSWGAFETWFKAQDLSGQNNIVDLSIEKNIPASETVYGRLSNSTTSDTSYLYAHPGAGMAWNDTLTAPLAAVPYSSPGISIAGRSDAGFELLCHAIFDGFKWEGLKQGTNFQWPCIGVGPNVQVRNFLAQNPDEIRLMSMGAANGWGRITDGVFYGGVSGKILTVAFTSNAVERVQFLAPDGATSALKLLELNDATNNTNVRDCVFRTTAADQVVKMGTFSADSTNNFIRHTFTNIGSGFTVNTGALTTSGTDALPPAGSPVIGGGSVNARNRPDAKKNNRGMTPDAGALQRVPGASLPNGTINAPTFVAASGKLNMSGTATNAVSGRVTITSAEGRPQIGPLDIVLSGGNWTIPEQTGVPYGDRMADLVLLNSEGGSTTIQRAFYMPPTQDLPEGTAATPVADGQIIKASGTQLRAVSGTVRMTNPDTAEFPIVINGSNWTADIVGQPGVTYGGQKLTLLNPGGPNALGNGIGPGIIIDAISGTIQEPEVEPGAETAPLIPGGTGNYRRGLLLRLAA